MAWILRLCSAAVVIYALIVAYMYVMQRTFMFPASSYHPELAKTVMPQRTREIKILTPDGLELLAWYAPPEGDHPVLLLLHGNAGTIEERAYKIAPFVAKGYGALLLEYRGYGGNPGTASEVGLYTDALAAVGFLLQQGYPPARLVLWGESLGTGVAVQTAVSCAQLNMPVKGVLLEAPYTSIVDVAAAAYKWLPVRYLMAPAFESKSRIRSIKAPLLILHGDHDPVIPYTQSRELYAAALEPKELDIIPNAVHMNLFESGGDAYFQKFLSSL